MWLSYVCDCCGDVATGNEFFVHVESGYVQDTFNLTGLDAHVTFYDNALGIFAVICAGVCVYMLVCVRVVRIAICDL